MDIWNYALSAGAGLLVALHFFRQFRRAAAITALASRLGFTCIGSAFPHSLTLHGTPLENATSVWNVIDGDRHGLRVVAFDCRIGRGKGSWLRSAIAVESDKDV